MSANRPSTPPPRSATKIPQAPKHGSFEDNYDAYSPRKSSRISSQRAQRAAATPSPELSNHNVRGSANFSPGSRKKNGAPAGFHDSPPLTVVKKRSSGTSSERDNRRVSGALTEESTASAAAALGLSPQQDNNGPKASSHHPSTAYRNGSMLPTPVKTPQKSPSKSSPAMTPIARKLFVRPATTEDAMPSPKKARKSYSGFSLDSFTAEDEAAPIKIYTDSSERIPEVDLSMDNPFYGPGSVRSSDPPKKTVRRGKVTIPGEGEVPVEEAEARQDGIVCVFRGKYVWRSTAQQDAEDEAEAAAAGPSLNPELDHTVPARLRGPLTRSSLKPRLLFSTPEQSAVKEKKAEVTDDEEVMTDLEDPFSIVVTSPAKHVNDFTVNPSAEPAVTPAAPRFAPVSPPTTARASRSNLIDVEGSASLADPVTPTARATRSMRKMEIDSPATSNPITPSPSRSRRAKVSPFDRWQRTKATISPGQAQKREGEALTRSGGEFPKRRRRRSATA